MALIREFLVIDAGHFDVDVDAVQQRSADALLVAGDGRAATFSDGIAIETARAPCRKLLQPPSESLAEQTRARQ